MTQNTTSDSTDSLSSGNGDDSTVLNSVDEAVTAVAKGEMIIVVDDEDRENEGDLIMAAELATAADIAFMVRHTSGILCVPVTPEDSRRLALSPMVSDNNAPLQTAFTVSVDYRIGLTTGISAEERTSTIRAMANRNVPASDFVKPGHVFPLVAREGGVLTRTGHTEAGVDLARMAGLSPMAVLAEIVHDDGSMQRLPALLQFAEEHGLKIVSIADIIAYRQRRERLVDRVGQFEVDTQIGKAKAIAFSTPFDAVQHLALVYGDVGDGDSVPVRIHRENIVMDVFTSRAFPDDDLIALSMELFRARGRGVLLYLREGSSGVPAEALGEAAEAPQSMAPDSEQARYREWRDVGVGAQILRELGINSIRLLAKHERAYVGLRGFGIEINGTEILE